MEKCHFSHFETFGPKPLFFFGFEVFGPMVLEALADASRSAHGILRIVGVEVAMVVASGVRLS